MLDSRPSFLAAQDFPPTYLKWVLYSVADLAIKRGQRVTLTGWFSDEGVHLCTDRCCEGLYGTYTVVPDVEHIEYLANRAEPPEGTAMITRPAGRCAAVLPGSSDTKRPWEGRSS